MLHRLIFLLFGFCVPGADVIASNSNIRLNRNIELLAAGKPTFGIFSANHSLANARALAVSDLDYIIIDMEHQPYDTERLRAMLLGMIDKQALLKQGNLQPRVTPVVRVPQNGRENLQLFVKQALDVGAFGIMFPYVETADEARAAVSAMRFPHRKGQPAAEREPAGVRGFATANASWYWGLTLADYNERADVWPLDPAGELLSILQIESAKAVRNIDEILAVPGIGVIFVGPNDLAQSLGAGVNLDDAELEAAIARVLQACQAKKIPCGITAYTPALAEKRVAQGFSFITIGLDGGMSPVADTTLKAARAAVAKGAGR